MFWKPEFIVVMTSTSSKGGFLEGGTVGPCSLPARRHRHGSAPRSARARVRVQVLRVLRSGAPDLDERAKCGAGDISENEGAAAQ